MAACYLQTNPTFRLPGVDGSCPNCAQEIQLTEANISEWLLNANLATIGKLQELLARNGFELHIQTSPITIVQQE